MFLPLSVCADGAVRLPLLDHVACCLILLFQQYRRGGQGAGGEVSSDNYLLHLALCASINARVAEHVSFPKITLPNDHTKHAHANNL